MNELKGNHINITGIVQGVGFRPSVYALAIELGLNGWVRNTSAGVDIQVDGDEDSLSTFIQKLKDDVPPLARIDSFTVDHCEPNGYSSFEIVHSEPIPGAFIPISPDVSTCDDCLQELMTPSNFRYLYPFINCTNCGPRFTIINDIPYDRLKTTMAPFEMCVDCRREYENPLNRRFHAQPVACSKCGPHLWIEISTSENSSIKSSGPPSEGNAPTVIHEVQKYLSMGKIVAIKGLGGFHLACDATNPEAVIELRRRKLRVDKPFALMMAGLDIVEKHCYLTEIERELLTSREKPIVLLKRKLETNISPAVAPNQSTLGVMLPYTPLHYLLFSRNQSAGPSFTNPDVLWSTPLVMTSGNISEEPIAIDNLDAKNRLSSLADIFLMHNRDIKTRCDDSVVRQKDNNSGNINKIENKYSNKYFLRRSRGYAPDPLKLPFDSPQVIATGPELKNTFCLTKEKYAFLSHHIGDMENYETLSSFEEGIKHYENLFHVEPDAVACDLHPNYLATRYAIERSQSENLPLYKVQHHHAHIASCMVDNGLNGDRPVIGLAFDGTGYGSDGLIWGGEFLIADYQGYHRFAHLEYSPLPGGDAGTRNPFRIALAQLWQKGIDWDEDLPPVIASCSDDMSMLRSMLENGINTPQTSSMGRLFDAVAALVGVRGKINYEAQAAIEFEGLCDPNEDQFYNFEISQKIETGMDKTTDHSPFSITTAHLFKNLIQDIRSNIPISQMSAKFHNGLANLSKNICIKIRNQYSLNDVALSGGVWQNMTLLRKTVHLLEKSGFNVFLHQQVPPNDGGISLGQAVVAGKLMQV